MAKKRIGILTGGGDVPGLNSVIKTVVYRSSENDIEVVGLRRGWEALTHLNFDDPNSRRRYVVALDRENTRTIDRHGGTVLHSSRTNPAKMQKLPDHLAGKDLPVSVSSKNATTSWDVSAQVLANLSALGIDHLISIGGDDTLGYAAKLNDLGVKIIAIPKTMDNYVHGTDYCIGFSTAVTRGVQFIHNLRTSTGSHERIAVVELFGRYSGETSLITAYLAGVDRAIISEIPFDIDRLADLLVADKRNNPSSYSMVTISEGAVLTGGDMVLSGEEDAYGPRKLGGIGQLTGELLKERTGEGIIYQQVGYLMRSGSPDSLDLMVATNYAVMAADLAVEGSTGRMVALRNGTYTTVPISVTKEGVKRVDVDELYDTAIYRPKLRHVPV
jgi:6-phosphofructokinase 1